MENRKPCRIVLATTGTSSLAQNLCRGGEVCVAGIIDFSNSPAQLSSLALMAHGVPIHTFTGFESLYHWIEGKGAQLLISYRVPYLIPQRLLSLFPMGGVNIHPSLLPRHRGANPWFEMYYEMDLQGGVTLHRMDAQFDHGDILAQEPFMIEPGEPLSSAREKADGLAFKLLGRVLKNWECSPSVPQKRDGMGKKEPMIIDKSLLAWEGYRLWHLLRGFPEIIETMGLHSLPPAYRIGGYRTVPHTHKKLIGTLLQREGEILFIVQGGAIVLEATE